MYICTHVSINLSIIYISIYHSYYYYYHFTILLVIPKLEETLIFLTTWESILKIRYYFYRRLNTPKK